MHGRLSGIIIERRVKTSENRRRRELIE